MKKEKIGQLCRRYPKVFRGLLSVLHLLVPGNRLRTKGCNLHMGLAILFGLKIKCRGSNNEIYIEDFAQLKNCSIVIYGSNNTIRIGKHTFLKDVELYMEDNGNEIHIGEHTSLCGKGHFAAIEGTKIKIGDQCLFSGKLHFRTGDSHSILNMEGERINPSKDIEIGNHVWIGTHVTCLKGVFVADNSMVAANCTLNKRYEEPNCIIGGLPGKVLKQNINWCGKRI